MAMTETILISNSIALLGHKPIITLDNPDDMTLAAQQAYSLLLPGVLSMNNWRFATQIAQLSELVETPPSQSPWTSIYALPAGFLKNIRIYPQNYQYDIYENRKLYTNWNGPVFMEYVFQPDVSLLPPHFTNYFVYEIAAYLALSNAQKAQYFSVLEAKRVQMQAMACAVEAQNRPNFNQVYFPMIDNRIVTTFDGNVNA